MTKHEFLQQLQQFAASQPTALAAAISELQSNADVPEYRLSIMSLPPDYFVCFMAFVRLMQWWQFNLSGDQEVS
jgi:hypothetical protein